MKAAEWRKYFADKYYPLPEVIEEMLRDFEAAEADNAILRTAQKNVLSSRDAWKAEAEAAEARAQAEQQRRETAETWNRRAAPDALVEARESVRWFAGVMETKLHQHDDRPGWDGEYTGWLLDRLREETREVKRELEKCNYTGSRKVIEECADVANFAMMIADVSRAALRPVERGEEGA